MESLVSFSKWLSKWFTVAVILWAAFNYALPATSSWVIPNTAYLLGLILFGMGLTLTTEDFKRIAKRPIPVVLGTVAHYVIMPGLAWLLCMIFHLKGATAAGVILVGSCPSGTSSSVMAFLSGGDVALDVLPHLPGNEEDIAEANSLGEAISGNGHLNGFDFRNLFHRNSSVIFLGSEPKYVGQPQGETGNIGDD